MSTLAIMPMTLGCDRCHRAHILSHITLSPKLTWSVPANDQWWLCNTESFASCYRRINALMRKDKRTKKKGMILIYRNWLVGSGTSWKQHCTSPSLNARGNVRGNVLMSYPWPDIPEAKVPKIDPEFKSTLRKTTVDCSDEQLAKIATILAACSPLANLLSHMEDQGLKGQQRELIPTTAKALLGNAVLYISQARRTWFHWQH